MEKLIQDEEQEKKEPINIVLEVQNGRIGIFDTLKPINNKTEEVEHGEISSR